MKFLALGEIVEILDSKRRPISKKDRKKGPYPYYGATGIVDYIDGYIFDEELVLVGEDGAKWKSMDNTAFTIKGKTWVNNHAHVLRPNSEIVLRKFLIYYLNFKDLSEFVKGITVPKLNQTNLKLIPIPVPSLQKQEKIIERLDKVFENIDKASVVKENEMLSLTNLFDSFLDNKIEEFGESEQKLGEYYDVRDGTHDSPKHYEKGYPLITSKNLKDGQLNFEKIKFISEEDFNKINERSKVNKGDVLMAMIGTIGNPVVIKDNSKFAIKNVALFKLNKNQSGEYLYYFLRSNKVKKKMMAEAKGTTQKFVGLGYLRNFTITGKFDLNAENEVVFLISKTENIINALFNNQQQLYTKLLELKKSVLKKEFSYE
jgi:type I restriction enzyme, S subunit